MIRWCAYCQKFLGEVPPFEDFSVTHGICAKCKAGAARISSAEVRDLRAIGDFYLELRDATRTSFPQATALLDHGLALDLAPLDLMMGMLQPALYDIGRLWASGERRVYEEHQLTALALAIVEHAFDRRPDFAQRRQSRAPTVLLLTAEGNTHTLGLRVVEYFLLDRGLSVFTVTPGLPAAEACELVAALRPRVLGVSVALAEQLEGLRAIAAGVAALRTPRPLLVAGGYALRHEPHDVGSLGFTAVSSPLELHQLAQGRAPIEHDEREIEG